MATTVGDILNEVRDFHPEFSEHALPSPMLARALSRFERRIMEQVVAQSEDALATELDLALPPAEGVVNPIPLPALLVLGLYVVHKDNGIRIPVSLVTWAEREGKAAATFPSATIMGGQVYPTDLRDYLPDVKKTGWQDYSQLVAMQVPLPGNYTSLEQAVALPDLARDALVLQLAMWCSSRTNTLLPGIVEQAREAQEALIHTLGHQDTTTTWNVFSGR